MGYSFPDFKILFTQQDSSSNHKNKFIHLIMHL